jgi:4-amino-4-deoxy-L-arabinose transferase-like glycosyltransferase
MRRSSTSPGAVLGNVDWRAAPLFLLIVVAAVYFWRLDAMPIYLAPDEAIIANDAYALAQTGRTRSGVLLPLYFYIEMSRSWFMPVVYYGIALALQVLPFAEWSIRVPTVVSAIVSIGLCMVVTRRMTGSAAAALVAGVTLAAAPAYFTLSRYALDYTYPVPSILCWLWCVAASLDSRRPRAWLFAAGASLGLGWYAYISSVVMMPVYLALTVAALAALRRPWRDTAALCAGFALMLVPCAVWVVNHPTVVTDTLARYGLVEAAAAGAAAPVPFDPVAMAWRFTSFFKTDFLFRLGDTYLPFSTRTIGVFVPAAGVLMALGIYSALYARRTVLSVLVFAAFVLSPLPASLLIDEGAIRRAAGLLPLGAVLAGCGAAWLLGIATIPFFRRAAAAAGLAALVVGGGYLLFVLVSQGRVSSTASRLVVIAAAALAAAAWSSRARHGALLLAPIVALMLLQFASFQRDYYGDYAVRVAPWLQGNIRGAVTQLMDEAERRPEARIYFAWLRTAGNGGDLRNRWMAEYFHVYAAMQHRQHLVPRATFFVPDDDVNAVPAGSLILGNRADPILRRMLDDSARRLADVPEINQEPFFTIIER